MRNPGKFVETFYAEHDLPSHVVFFDEHLAALRSFLEERGFVLEKSFFFSHVGNSRYLHLYRHLKYPE